MPEKKTRIAKTKSGTEMRGDPKRSGSTNQPAASGRYSSQTKKGR